VTLWRRLKVDLSKTFLLKYFLELSYHGGRYHGWQRQKNVMSVQEELESQLSQLLKEPIVVIGCGRTDAGVHASYYVAHIITNEIPGEHFIFQINKMLPFDIAIKKIYSVSKQAHAQRDAKVRTYTYHFHGLKNPLRNQVSTEIDFDSINFDRLDEALEILKQVNDFAALCKTPDVYKHTRCTISSIKRSDICHDEFTISVSANRFLRGMVRMMIAAAVKVGQGRLTKETLMEQVVVRHERLTHFEQAPAHGLWLTDVTY